MNAQYFIKFFSAIPDEKWMVGATGHADGRGCALHLAFAYSREQGRALVELFETRGLLVSHVNDRGVGNDYRNFLQITPKARILAALEYIQSLS